jgi:uncharacterized protein
MKSLPSRLSRPIAEIRDPIHGYIYASELEKRIIDTAVFQRLRRIRQLAGCHLVYPGGQHSRFEHVIGCMYLAGLVGSILETKAVGVGEHEVQKLRVSALLHDIGHGPFSHMFEEVMAGRTEFTHEDMTRKIIRETEIGDILKEFGFQKSSISELATGQSEREKRFMNDVIGGGLSVDIMDYLLRDSYFTGVEYGKVDVHRIINSFEVVKDKLAISRAALFAFEALMIARYEMFRAVYFHRTVRAAELMLVKSMVLSDKELHLTDLSLENYLSMTDEVTLNRITTMDPKGDSELKLARSLAIDYQNRKLLKCVFERTVQVRDKFLTSIFNQKSFRDQLSERIAEKASVNVTEVFVDVPTAPSVPVSSTRESFREITLVGKRGNKIGTEEVGVNELPLIGTIVGFMDVLRIYTTDRNRKKVGEATARVLEGEGFETKVSM